MATAIVTGATGILGRAIVHELTTQPQQWSKIHALSRSKKEDYPKNVVHTHLDLTSSASQMSGQLGDIKPDYVFFAAYLQSSDEQEMCDTNGTMLKNFLDALDKTNLKRVVLVTGAKQYGVHLGQPKNPMEESDPWLRGSEWPPNFYYVQQDILSAAAEKAQWDWVVTYPNDVIGVAKGNFMNMPTALGIYAAVTKELAGSSSNAELPFPGSPIFYRLFDCFTSAKFHAKFCNWAATAAGASNEAFNVVNGDTCSWQSMWPQLAKHFGMTVPKDQFSGIKNDPSEMKLAPRPPVAEFVTQMGLEGTDVIKQSFVRQHIDLVRWSQRQDVKDAWNKLAEREGLENEALDNATWGFLGFVLGREYDIVISMNKARKAGWTGHQDTWEALQDVFTELEQERILPKQK